MSRKLKIGLDLHGVIDLYPALFSRMSKNLANEGAEIHIITGQEKEKIIPKLEKYQITYDHLFSIVDYHFERGTEMWKDCKGTWWMDERFWLRSKGDYMDRAHIDIHFDDSFEYAKFVPPFCTFILVPKTNFELFAVNMSDWWFDAH